MTSGKWLAVALLCFSLGDKTAGCVALACFGVFVFARLLDIDVAKIFDGKE